MTDTTLDPIRTTNRILSSYRSYLTSSFHLADDRLRTDFETAIDSGFRLSQGPLLHAAAPYQPAERIADLIREGTLHPDIAGLDPAISHPDRPLYAHQAQAVRLITSGHNALIATGTGSGKTECFLYPILDNLLREREAGTLGPGVRALLLYPMNALANDQMGRIRDLFRPFPELTFGRYIGDTKSSRSQAMAAYRERHGDDPPSNEIIDRAAMQAAPPHVLLTNYAMLEYLLLRPEDSALFDGPSATSWRFIVLDEVHVYDGAKGAELGMLLRRVRDRVNRSVRGQLRCVATSATLGSGDDAPPQLAVFAEQLFDEPFTSATGEPNVVQPVRLPLAAEKPGWSADPSSFLPAQRAFRETGDPRAVHAALGPGAPPPVQHEPIAVYLDRALRHEQHVLEVQRLLESGSVDLDTAAEDVFGRSQTEAFLVALVDLCVAARPSDQDPPLLPARYHFFLRSLEGAFCCLHPDHPEDEPRLILSRNRQCPSCDVVSVLVELAVCVKCGAAYAVGALENRLLTAPLPDSRRIDYLLLDSFWGRGAAEDEDEDERAVEGAGTTRAVESVYCCGCGLVTEGAASKCGCSGAAVRLTRAVPSKAADDDERCVDLRRCLACAGRAPSVARRLVTGADAPVAVVATSLYQDLPPSRDPRAAAQVGAGRKLLSFADSRQDAAFFAPYLERTYLRAVERRLIWAKLEPAEEEQRFEDLIVPVRKLAESSLVLDEDDGSAANSSRVRSWLFREVVGVDRRHSLAGVGLAEVTVAIPREVKAGIPPALLSMGFSPDEALDLARVLLDTLCRSAAVWLPEGVDISDQIFSPRNLTTVMRMEQSDNRLLAWLPGSSTNSRLDYLTKLCQRRGIDTDPGMVLRKLWTSWFVGADSPWSKVLRHEELRGKGTVYAISPDWICFLPAGRDHRPFRCSRCRQLWWRSVSDVCPGYRCDGTLEREDGETGRPNHYRDLYTNLGLIGAKVEEHTAQLETQFASEVQARFSKGLVNILSCSTTFELGVDVGEVQAVLLRNVPPSAANYVQRAGRAGRRADAAALVVTYAQRRNHDMQIFDEPRRMVDGAVNPPIVKVDIPAIVRRHVHAMAFAAFQRREVDAGRTAAANVGEFFMAEGPDAAPRDRWMDWLRTGPSELLEAVDRVCPPEARVELDNSDGWVEALDTIDLDTGTGWLARATTEVRHELEEIEAEYLRAKGDDHLSFALALQDVGDTLRARSLLGFLAQRVVLPKYGFPVDVVSMDVLQAGDRDSARVELTRDLNLALLDYAPGAELVAAKVLWQSIGLRKLPGRALLERSWAVCGECGTFRSRLGAKSGEAECGSCGSGKTRDCGTFIEPSFGFVGTRAKDVPGDNRPRRTGSKISHFEEYQGVTPLESAVDVGGPADVHIRYSRQAMITSVAGGRAGYWVCSRCGHADNTKPKVPRGQDKPKDHERPGRASGQTCNGRLAHRQLGHRYLTDAVEIRLPDGALAEKNSDISVLHAILLGAPRLGIKRQDIDGVLRPGVAARTLVVVDAVPGGAGHARFLAERVPSLLTAALEVVERCECGEDSSCYGCLRSYENQLFQDRLRRGVAADVLALVLGRTRDRRSC